jgi:phosphoribosylamine---glycine ligase
LNLLIVDTDGVGLALAWRATQAGHAVRWFRKPKPNMNATMGRGFGVQTVDNWVAHMSWADLVFTTSNDDYLPRLDFFRKKGTAIYAPTVASANLEIKRADGMKFLEKHGIECPPYKTFKTMAEAEKYVMKTEERYCFKTLGDNEDKALTYAAKSPADMVGQLRRWQKLGMNPKGEVMLQTFIKGVEIGVSCWVGKEGYIGKPTEHFEHKKLMPGEIGCNTGEMGTLAAYVDGSKLAEMIMKPIEADVVKTGHLSDCAVNCIVDEKGKPWPLEFTMRPGWPAFNIMLSQHKGDPIQWMYDAIRGKNTLQVSTEMAIGVVLAQPDFPYSNATKKETDGVPIYGVTKKNAKYIQPQAVKLEKLPDMEGEKIVERPMWATAGDYLAVVTGMGKTIAQARKRAYATVDEISVSNMIYRNDIGEKVKAMLPDLHKHGIATAFEYGET